MWSFGCIIAELTTGRPLFPALDENELLELFITMIGLPPKHMIDKAKKKAKFFDKHDKIIRSKQSRVINLEKKSYPIRDAIYCQDDPEFIDFIEVIILYQ